MLKSPNEEDEHRVYDEFIDEIIEGRFEVDEAAIIFIGRNIQNKFKSETINKIKQIVEIILGQDTYISQCMPKILDVEEWD
ncbi:MAG: hypothetical protein ACK5QV_03820, partial [Dolichospermum sp.]